MDQEIRNLLTEYRYQAKGPESAENIEKLERYFESKGVNLPSELKDIYLELGPGSGNCREQFFSLWTISRVIKINTTNEAFADWRSYILIGSDGGNEAWAFDISVKPLPVVMVPRIGLSSHEDA